MKLHEEILKKLIEKGAKAWSDIELSIQNKTKILRSIHVQLAIVANPAQENQVKIEIIRMTCSRIKQMYPTFAKEADLIINRFEHNLKFDHMAVLPFKQLDALTYRIFLNNSLFSFAG